MKGEKNAMRVVCLKKNKGARLQCQETQTQIQASGWHCSGSACGATLTAWHATEDSTGGRPLTMARLPGNMASEVGGCTGVSLAQP